MTISELAKLMGRPESDVIAFVNCLRGYMDQRPTMTLEQAIEHHMKVNAAFLNNATKIARMTV